MSEPESLARRALTRCHSHCQIDDVIVADNINPPPRFVPVCPGELGFGVLLVGGRAFGSFVAQGKESCVPSRASLWP